MSALVLGRSALADQAQIFQLLGQSFGLRGEARHDVAEKDRAAHRIGGVLRAHRKSRRLLTLQELECGKRIGQLGAAELELRHDLRLALVKHVEIVLGQADRELLVLHLGGKADRLGLQVGGFGFELIALRFTRRLLVLLLRDLGLQPRQILGTDGRGVALKLIASWRRCLGFARRALSGTGGSARTGVASASAATSARRCAGSGRLARCILRVLGGAIEGDQRVAGHFRRLRKPHQRQESSARYRQAGRCGASPRVQAPDAFTRISRHVKCRVRSVRRAGLRDRASFRYCRGRP